MPRIKTFIYDMNISPRKVKKNETKFDKKNHFCGNISYVIRSNLQLIVSVMHNK